MLKDFEERKEYFDIFLCCGDLGIINNYEENTEEFIQANNEMVLDFLH